MKDLKNELKVFLVNCLPILCGFGYTYCSYLFISITKCLATGSKGSIIEFLKLLGYKFSFNGFSTIFPVGIIYVLVLCVIFAGHMFFFNNFKKKEEKVKLKK